MKLMLEKYIALSLVCVAFAACKREQLVDPDDLRDEPILFSPSMEISETKANTYRKGDIEDIDDLKEWKFGVMGYDSNNKAMSNTGNGPTRGISHMWSGTEWTYSNDGETQVWRNYTPPMDFYAYYPLMGVDANKEKFQKTYNPTGEVMLLTGWVDGVDVLYARSTGRNIESHVPLYFKHAFTKIEKVNFKIPSDSPLTFHIATTELTATHCETDGKMILRKTGNMEYVAGATRKNRMVTLSSEVVVSKSDTQGKNLIVGTDNAYMFPVTTDGLWDGQSVPGVDDVSLSKTCLHLKAKVKQGEEIILQGSGEYIIGSETQYGDIYLPIKGTSNPNQELEAGKRYTISVLLKSGVGYNKDGKTYLPIDLSVTVDDWVAEDVSVGQVTVRPSEAILNAGNSYTAEVVVNCAHTNLSQLSATCSPNLSASFRVFNNKVYLTIEGVSPYTPGTGSVTVNDQFSNSMTSVSVTIE